MNFAQEAQSNVDVESLRYFYADVTRQQAEDILKRYKGTPDHFLLRWSSSHDKIAISCVMNEGKIGHALVFRSAAGRYFLEDKVRFDTLDDLVNYYSISEIPNVPRRNLCVRLRFPVTKFRRPAPCPWQVHHVQYEILTDPQYAWPGEHIPKLRASYNTAANRTTIHQCQKPVIKRFTRGPCNDVTSPLTPPTTPPREGIVCEETSPKLVLQEEDLAEDRYISMHSIRQQNGCAEAPPIPRRKTLPT